VSDLPISADVFTKPLDTLLIAMKNRLDREWPVAREADADSAFWLRAFVFAAGNSYHTVNYLCLEHGNGDSAPPVYALAVAPLARVILEAVASTIFLFDDLSSRLLWFRRSHARELAQGHEHLIESYGGDPKWKASITRQGALAASVGELAGLADSHAPVAHQKKLNWPTPLSMQKQMISPERKTRLKYLMRAFYGPLSTSAHLKGSGLTFSVLPMLLRSTDPRYKEFLHHRRSELVVVTAAMLTALLSELECELHYGHRTHLQYVWATLAELRLEAKELYQTHYRDRLSAA